MLACWMMLQTAAGYTPTMQQICTKGAELEGDSKGLNEEQIKNIKPKSAKWGRKFVDRFPFISKRTPSKQGKDRVTQANPTVVAKFFKSYQAVVDKHNIKSIWNMDESFIQLSKNGTKVAVYGIRGAQKAYVCDANFTEHITVIDAVSNTGECVRPVLIFKGKLIPEDLAQGCGTRVKVTVTDKGWTNDDVFRLWMDHFIESTQHCAKPMLLCVDGHRRCRGPTTSGATFGTTFGTPCGAACHSSSCSESSTCPAACYKNATPAQCRCNDFACPAAQRQVL